MKKIVGEIDCNTIEISGYVKGKVTANDLLNMKETSKIEGDIIAGKLSVEPGSIFTGTCAMRGAGANNEPAKIKAQVMPPIKVIETIKPVKKITPGESGNSGV